MGMFSNLDPEGLREMQNGQLVLIDVRTDRELMRGMIPCARHIPLHMLPSRMEEIGDDVPIVFYCQSGARSAQASKYFSDNGRKQVYNLSGGFAGWVARGFPVVQSPS